MSTTLEEIEHPNKLRFFGRLCTAGKFSDKSPSGARGHRIRLTKAAVIEALPTIEGMGLCFTEGWDGHNTRLKIGLISRAWMEGDEVYISGHLYAKDFAAEIDRLRKMGDMGLSYDLHDAQVEDMRQGKWTITRFVFTGAALLQREKASYRDSSFYLGAEGATVDIAATGKEREHNP